MKFIDSSVISQSWLYYTRFCWCSGFLPPSSSPLPRVYPWGAFSYMYNASWNKPIPLSWIPLPVSLLYFSLQRLIFPQLFLSGPPRPSSPSPLPPGEIPLGTFRYSYLLATTSKIPSSPINSASLSLSPRASTPRDLDDSLSYKGFSATYNISEFSISQCLPNSIYPAAGGGGFYLPPSTPPHTEKERERDYWSFSWNSFWPLP